MKEIIEKVFNKDYSYLPLTKKHFLIIEGIKYKYVFNKEYNFVGKFIKFFSPNLSNIWFGEKTLNYSAYTNEGELITDKITKWRTVHKSELSNYDEKDLLGENEAIIIRLQNEKGKEYILFPNGKIKEK